MSNPSISQESIISQEPAQCKEADQEMEQESEMKEFESAKNSSQENVEQIISPENSEKSVQQPENEIAASIDEDREDENEKS